MKWLQWNGFMLYIKGGFSIYGVAFDEGLQHVPEATMPLEPRCRPLSMKQNYCHQMKDTTPSSLFFGMIIHNLWDNIPSQTQKGERLRPMMASFLWCSELNAEAGRGLESLDRYTHSTRMTEPWRSLLLSLAFGSANNKPMTAKLSARLICLPVKARWGFFKINRLTIQSDCRSKKMPTVR